MQPDKIEQAREDAMWARSELMVDGSTAKRLDRLSYYAEEYAKILETLWPLRCPDCAVLPGFPHKDGCDVERCTVCHGQRLQCECEGHDKHDGRWTGMWPRVEACRDLEWYAKLVPGRGWVPCSREEAGGDADANEDLNRWAVFAHNERGRNREAFNA